jgi:hypothetical protein
MIVACVVLGIVTGVLALWMMRVTMIVATAVVGSYAVIKGIQYYAMGDQFVNDFDLVSNLSAGGSVDPSIYGYFAGMLVLAAIGIFVQLKWTGKKKEEGEKDEWEQEFDDAEISLKAFSSECASAEFSIRTRFVGRVCQQLRMLWPVCIPPHCAHRPPHPHRLSARRKRQEEGQGRQVVQEADQKVRQGRRQGGQPRA